MDYRHDARKLGGTNVIRGRAIAEVPIAANKPVSSAADRVVTSNACWYAAIGIVEETRNSENKSAGR
jgi:hypothetical protein